MNYDTSSAVLKFDSFEHSDYLFQEPTAQFSKTKVEILIQIHLRKFDSGKKYEKHDIHWNFKFV